MALKDPAEDHVGQGHAHPVVRVGEEGGTDAIGLLPERQIPGRRLAGWWRCAGRGVSPGPGPPPTGVRTSEIVPPPLRGIHGDQAARQPHLRAALQFLDTADGTSSTLSMAMPLRRSGHAWQNSASQSL